MTKPVLAVAALLFAGIAVTVLMVQFASGQAGSQERRFNDPQPATDPEQRVLEVIAEMEKEDRTHLAVAPNEGRYLRQMTEAVNAQRVVEIGTSTGYSGLWFGLALQSTGGQLLTHEIDQERAETARKHFKKAGIADQVTVIEGDAHETVEQHDAPIDVVFLDADKKGYIDYLDKLLPLVKPGGLILAHNMNRPQPDPRYINAITSNPSLETTFLFMEQAGIGVTLKKRNGK